MLCSFMDKWSVDALCVLFLLPASNKSNIVRYKLTAHPKQLKDEETAGGVFDNDEEVNPHQNLFLTSS